MELVTLVQVTLHRPGSMSAPGMTFNSEITDFHEVDAADPETLRELVINVAEHNGESRKFLQAMAEEQPRCYPPEKGLIVFNVQPLNTFYGTPYATCRSFPALKVQGRYFKLEEIKGPSGTGQGGKSQPVNEAGATR